MSKYIVEIADEEGHSFKVACSLDLLARVSGGNWRTLDKGGIRPNNGRLAVVSVQGTLTTDHLLFLDIQSDLWGIRLNDFRDFLGVNDGGTGYLAQRWALGSNSHFGKSDAKSIVRTGRLRWSKWSELAFLSFSETFLS